MFSVVQIGANADRAKVFFAHAAPLGLYDNLVNALKLSWRISRKMVTARFKASLQDCMKEAEEAPQMD